MRRHHLCGGYALGGLLLLTMALPCSAQRASARTDTIGYADLVTTTTNADPRQRQIELHGRATAYRLQTIDAERMPTLGVNGQTQYQSAVTRIAVGLPGVSVPIPAHDSYDAHLSAEESLYDPTRASRRAVEVARLAESRAIVRSALFMLRQEVSDAFFSAMVMQERVAETDAALVDLTARLRETVARFREGAALRGDTASLAATITERQQDRLTLVADRGVALARLMLLTGRPISDSAVLVSPATATLLLNVTRSLDTLRERPEYEQFTAVRERLTQQSRLVSARERPRVVAFGRLGYGRPGLNMLSSDFQSYWVAGVQFRWSPIGWGNTVREHQLLEVERSVVATNEEAFARSLQRSVQPSLAAVARLDSTLVLDERVITLREQVLREAQAQLREGAVTAAAYVDRSTELLAARLRRAQHRVLLDQARVTLLNTLGVEVR